MPRGGSRKGERRGAAKFAGHAVGEAVKTIGSFENKRHKRGEVAVMRVSERTLKREDMLADLLKTAKSFPQPKERMHQAMTYAFRMAESWQRLMETNQALAVQATDPATIKDFEKIIAEAESKVMAYLREGVSWAAQAAPYYHPRLSAAVSMGGNFEDGPFAAIKSILDEIAGNSRPVQVIEHKADELPVFK